MKLFFNEWKQEIKDFFNFLKKPHQNFSSNHSFYKKQKTLTALFLFEIMFTLLIVFPADYLVNKIYHLRYSDEFTNFTLLEIFLLGVLIVPFLEESVFRFPLKYKRNYVFQFFDLFSEKKEFKNFWFSKFSYFFYSSVFLFGLIHVFNYSNKITGTFLLLSVFLTLSQISGGLIMGYLRLKFGFLTGFFYHALWNFVAFLMMYLVYHNNEILKYEKDETRIQLTELNVMEGNNIFISKKIKNDTIYSLEMKNGNLQDVFDIVAPEYHSDEISTIHFYLKSKKGIHKDELFKILKQNIQLDSIDN